MRASIKAILNILCRNALVQDYYHRKLVAALERALDCEIVGHVPVSDYQKLLEGFMFELENALEDVLESHMADLDLGRIVGQARVFEALGAVKVYSVQNLLAMDIELLEVLLAGAEYPFSQFLLVMHPRATRLHQVQLHTRETKIRSAVLRRLA